MATTLSAKGAAFVRKSEGTVLRAYRDSVHVVTIGVGFTWGSKVFRSYWMKTRKHKLRMGDTITTKECNTLLRSMFDQEYGPAVVRGIGSDKPQYVFDVCASMCWNLGPGCMKWKWAKAARAGDYKGSAAKIRVTGTTAGGRRIQGLVNRRREEAHLMETGEYNIGLKHPTKASESKKSSTMEYQRLLKELGYYKMKVDGIAGKGTDAAVLAFQKDHPQLTNDGIVGNATLNALIRAVDVKKTKKSTPVTAIGGILAASAGVQITTGDVSWTVIAGGIALLVGLGFIVYTWYRYKDELTMRKPAK